METKHTKGEWILNEKSSEIVSSNDCSKNGGIDVIANCYCGFDYESTMDECKANAKLIAASPELLEALNESYEFIKILMKQLPMEMQNMN